MPPLRFSVGVEQSILRRENLSNSALQFSSASGLPLLTGRSPRLTFTWDCNGGGTV